MATNEAPRPFSSYREAIHAFLQERLSTKLEKLKADEEGKRTELLAQHQPIPWLEDAARRVQQIQVVTHSLKPIHPDARGTNLYAETCALPQLAELGSHALGGDHPIPGGVRCIKFGRPRLSRGKWASEPYPKPSKAINVALHTPRNWLLSDECVEDVLCHTLQLQ